MAQYIDKTAVIVEIEREKAYAQTLSDNAINNSMKQFYDGMKECCNELLNSLDTLEVKEVDLEEELKSLIEKEKAFVTDNREVKYYNGDSFNHIYELEFIAKHFFELGLKVQKGSDE